MLAVSIIVVLCDRCAKYHKYAAITAQGKVMSVPTSRSYAIIDTANTLIGAPTSIVANIWSQVPGSKALNGEYTGLYAFRQCHLHIVEQTENSSISSLHH